jgi:hypothetical protein
MGLNIDELSTMDATAQAKLVRRRELTPLELVDAAIARIERVNPTINAVITRSSKKLGRPQPRPTCLTDRFAACRSSLKTSARCRRVSPTTWAIGHCATPIFVRHLTLRSEPGFVRPG